VDANTGAPTTDKDVDSALHFSTLACKTTDEPVVIFLLLPLTYVPRLTAIQKIASFENLSACSTSQYMESKEGVSLRLTLYVIANRSGASVVSKFEQFLLHETLIRDGTYHAWDIKPVHRSSSSSVRPYISASTILPLILFVPTNDLEPSDPFIE
jgi:hypothetical protein